MPNKKKLLVVMGAGASKPLGMPSVADIDLLFAGWAQPRYSLAPPHSGDLYTFLKNAAQTYCNSSTKAALKKTVNFEEVLYLCLYLYARMADSQYWFSQNAFSQLNALPDIQPPQGRRSIVGIDLRHLALHLVDSLLAEFRNRCATAKAQYANDFAAFEQFWREADQQFDLGIVTLNYDDLVGQCLPNFETGFDSNGGFSAGRIFNRKGWRFIYHLHGSIHFDMVGRATDMHAVKWNPQYTGFQQNALGRNSQTSMEGLSFPTSVIVAGYGKTNQILRNPFRTYWSELDRLVEEADAYLFMGYGFGDLHLNHAFGHGIGSRRRPVLLVTYADDTEDALAIRHDEWAVNVGATIPIGRLGTGSLPFIGDLKANADFELLGDANTPIAVWYDGTITACKHGKKLLSFLAN